MFAVLEGLPAIALVFGLGAAAQWLAWRLRIPAILLLLIAGFVAGQVAGVLDPTVLFGEAFRPLVSFAVALILFEGGLSLRFDELRGSGSVVRNLVSIAAAVTWVLSTLIGVYVVGVSFEVALLVGAILVLTGPTVVIPIVRHVRPRPPLGPILRWEGILIDPIGALLALLVLEALTVPSGGTPWHVVAGVLRTVVFGGGLGFLGGIGLSRALERFLVPDMLHVPVTFGAVAVTFATANLLQPEAGLLAVTVLGITMANRRGLDTAQIVEWKEQLATILLSVLFVCIAATLPLDQLTKLGWRALAYALLLILVVRPVAVWLATLRSPLRLADRAFLACMAPRGIVAAAVASEFSLHYEHAAGGAAGGIVALVFPVIVVSVTFYGLLGRPIGRWLGVAQGDPQGVLIVGSDLFGREIGVALRGLGIDVLMVDTNVRNAAAARTLGLRTWHGSILSSRFADEAELAAIGNVLALTSSAEVNRLALLQFRSTFGRANLFRVVTDTDAREERETSMPGRVLFRSDATEEQLHLLLRAGWRIRTTKLTEQFRPAQFAAHNPDALPLFSWADGRLTVATIDQPAVLRPGGTVLSLVPPAGDAPGGTSPAATSGVATAG
jgi:NhaP-type Na+/H+ or K+/H+ antiporter